MLFNEQEMILLCREMGIDLIENDGNMPITDIDRDLFDIKVKENEIINKESAKKDYSEYNQFKTDKITLLAS